MFVLNGIFLLDLKNGSICYFAGSGWGIHGPFVGSHSLASCSASSGRQSSGEACPDEGVWVYVGRTIAGSAVRTSLAWKRVPATRVAMAIRSLWPQNTLTWRAFENSGRLTVRPLR